MFDRRRFLIASAAAAAGSYATMLDAAAVPHAASAKSSQDAIRKFLAHITPERLRARLYFIASDLFEGRDTGSFGQHATALYLGSEYVQLGFTAGFAASGPLIPESFFQHFKAERKRPKSSSLILNIAGRELPVSLPGGSGTAQAFFSGNDFQDAEAPIVFAGYGIEDEKAGYTEYSAVKQRGTSLNDKWIMLLDGEPKFLAAPDGKFAHSAFEKRFELAKVGNPKGVLVVSTAAPEEFQKQAEAAPHGVFNVQLRLADSSNYPAIFTISRDLADEILKTANTDIATIQKQIEDSKAPPHVELTNLSASAKFETYPAVETENVVAILPGSDPALSNEYIVVSAHHDHLGRDPERQGDQIFNGASDDGSGTVGLIEMADAFAAARDAGHGPRRSIIFLHTTAEEKGTRGSAYFVENPAVPLDSIVADLNMDGLGGFDPKHPRQSHNYIYITNHPSEMDAICQRALKLSGVDIELDGHADFNSDDRSFRTYQIPAIYYCSGLVKDYHQVTDEPQTIDYGHLARATQLAFATTWLLANEPIPAKHPPLSSLKQQGYKCSPCGLACDSLAFDAPGTCPCCGMELVKNLV
jgi:Peptidase family M28